LQEVHGSHQQHAQRHPAWPETPQYEFLADSMWPQFAYGRNAVYPHGDHGNALLSKFPIATTTWMFQSRATNSAACCIASWKCRAMTRCMLCAYTWACVSPSAAPGQLLLDLLASLPPDAPVIVAGDFNDWRLKADAGSASTW
jgi:endonuclease/exonuclease/phosphatase family metal-dependent hydrolase